MKNIARLIIHVGNTATYKSVYESYSEEEIEEILEYMARTSYITMKTDIGNHVVIPKTAMSNVTVELEFKKNAE